MSSTERIASSLPATGTVIRSGSALVSTIAINRECPSLLASLTAIRSFFESITNMQAREVVVMFLMPARLRDSLSRWRVIRSCSFFGVVLELAARLAPRLEVLETADLLLDRLEVGEESAQPALGHVERVGSLRLFLHNGAQLPLRADEQHIVAAQDDLSRQLLREVDLP